jgi:hypothetical protein
LQQNPDSFYPLFCDSLPLNHLQIEDCRRIFLLFLGSLGFRGIPPIYGEI